MSNEFIDQAKENASKVYAPWVKLNQAMLQNAEKMAAFSLQTLKHYSEMGLEHLHDMSDIDNAQDASELGEKSTELLNRVGQQMLKDAQEITELSNTMRDEIVGVLGESYGESASQMQATMQEAAETVAQKASELTQNINKMTEDAISQVAEASEEVSKAAKKPDAASKTAKPRSTAAKARTTKSA